MKPIDNRTSKRKPWMKWYTSDWRAEPTLRMVSRGARSVWVDLLGLMHESTLIGTLLLNGRIPTLQDLAKVLGDDPQKLAEWMDELKDAGVYSVDEEGAIYSRKMRHAAEISEKGRKDIQKRGGAWAPGKKKSAPKRSPERDPNRGANRDPMSQRLDTRTKEEELEPTLSSISQAHNSEANASEPNGSDAKKTDIAVPKQEPPPPSPLDFQKELWGRGVSYLKANGVSDSGARSVIGKWRKQTGSDFEVLELLSKAEGEAVSAPVPFIEGMLKLRKAKSNGKGQFGRTGQLTDHPLGIFGQLGDELRDREISGGGWSEDHGGHPH